MFDSTVNALRNAGWKVDLARGAQELPADIGTRYPGVRNSSVWAFLERLDSCVAPDETAWFLTPRELSGTAGSAFRWNEWELLSIDAADDDVELQEVTAFWDRHFPFLLSVRNEYSYVAVTVAGGRLERVVAGREPEFEHITDIAPSFERFLQKLIDAVSHGVDSRLRSFL